MPCDSLLAIRRVPSKITSSATARRFPDPKAFNSGDNVLFFGAPMTVVEQASPSAQPDARQDSPEPCLSNRAQSAICRGVRRSTFEVGLSTGRST
jgi:hypothetical protein